MEKTITTTAAAAAGKRPNKFKQFCSRIYRARLAYLFLLPLFFFLLTFSYYPAISGIYHSFFKWSDISSEFIGLKNYIDLFSDRAVFLPSLWTMVKITLPKLLIGVFMPLIVAELIFNLRSDRAKGVYRILVLLPIVAPGVVNTLIWGYIYDPNLGLLSAVYKAFGGGTVDWLGNMNTVIPAIIFMGFPWIGGTSVLIYTSGLMAISESVRESARLDGAGVMRRIFTIDLPLIVGQIRYFLIFGIIGGIQDYSVQFLLTDGGPAGSTMVPGYYMYKKAFVSGEMGYACAVGTFLFAIIMVLTLLSFLLGREKKEV